MGIEHTRIDVGTHRLTNRAISAYERARIYCDKYMDLGGYLVKRASRGENFKGLVKYHIDRINSTNDSHLISESHYWIGVAYNDYFNDKDNAIKHFFNSAKIIHHP